MDTAERILKYIVLIIIAICILLFCDIIENLEKEIKSLKEEMVEMQQEMGAYRDNYTALWTTVNNLQKINLIRCR